MVCKRFKILVEYDPVSEIVPRALTIAGSDSSGGAGIQADLKTFTALKVYGASVITAVTAQSTASVLGIENLDPEFVKLQIDAVVQDFEVNAVKIGMLSTEGIISAVSEKISEYRLKNIVLDPVIVSSGGDSLLYENAKEALVNQLFPQIDLLTPNIPEAQVISGMEIESAEDMKSAAEKIKLLGPENILIKGGHLDKSNEAVDILYDGKSFYEYRAERVNTKNTHGTGCTYSAAICAGLAKGLSMYDAVSEAKEFVTSAIRNSLDIGHGHGPLNHFWNIN